MALDETGGAGGAERGGASRADRQPPERAPGPDGARGSDGGGGVAIDRAADGARARDALGSPEARATLSEAAGRIDGGDEPGSAVGAAIGTVPASSAPSSGLALGGLQAQPPGAMPPAALTLAQDAAPRAGAGPTPGLPDPEAPFDPTPPPDTFMQRLREGVASDLGRTMGRAQAAAGWVGDMVGGAAAAVEAGYEAVVTGIEAATGWIEDEHARRQRDDLVARAEGLRAGAEELLGDPEGVARAFAASYEARYAQADALEAAYRGGHADLSAFREAERIRAEASAELAILGVETAAVAAAGAGAIMKGLRAARLADRLDGPTPLAMAMATAERARETATAIERLEAAPGRRSQFDVSDVDDELFLMSAGSRGGRVYPDELVARVVSEIEAAGGEVRRTDIDKDGGAYLDNREQVHETEINALTIGDIVFVRPEHAADVRTLLEELEHVKWLCCTERLKVGAPLSPARVSLRAA